MYSGVGLLSGLSPVHPNTIGAAAKHIEQEYDSLDVLINNVGVSLDKGLPPSQLELSILKETFENNFFCMFSVKESRDGSVTHTKQSETT
ncbi:hypothetical protein MAMMFC1_04052 [Methylomusa anaerophila]|uniref:3-oxoacyl-[acyl-carrier-protein] reductase FabG n=1 Tax=Methylomusa anaerophila TaxID=1930071 RepID=A0A348AQJ2_9FIRM|nr:hypothetical protein MAMMFC1_04052 [Methylomusa anaerophila]